MLQCAHKLDPHPCEHFKKSLRKQQTDPSIIRHITSILFPTEDIDTEPPPYK